MNDWKCKGCSKSCRQFTLPVKNKEELMKLFKEEYSFDLINPEVTVLFKGTCEHLVNNKCSKYETRPQRCRDFFCKRYPAQEAPDGALFKKRCRTCQKVRSFQAGTESPGGIGGATARGSAQEASSRSGCTYQARIPTQQSIQSHSKTVQSQLLLDERHRHRRRRLRRPLRLAQ